MCNHNNSTTSQQSGAVLLLVLVVISLFVFFGIFTLDEATRQQKTASFAQTGIQLRLACQSANQAMIHHFSRIQPTLWQTQTGKWHLCAKRVISRTSCSEVFATHGITTNIEAKYLIHPSFPTIQIHARATTTDLACEEVVRIHSIAQDPSDDLAQSLRVDQRMWVEP